jgi:hypothetical protein
MQSFESSRHTTVGLSNGSGSHSSAVHRWNAKTASAVGTGGMIGCRAIATETLAITAQPTIPPTPTDNINFRIQLDALTGRVISSCLVGGLGLLPVPPPSDSVKTIVSRKSSCTYHA